MYPASHSLETRRLRNTPRLTRREKYQQADCIDFLAGSHEHRWVNAMICITEQHKELNYIDQSNIAVRDFHEAVRLFVQCHFIRASLHKAVMQGHLEIYIYSSRSLWGNTIPLFDMHIPFRH